MQVIKALIKWWRILCTNYILLKGRRLMHWVNASIYPWVSFWFLSWHHLLFAVGIIWVHKHTVKHTQVVVPSVSQQIQPAIVRVDAEICTRLGYSFFFLCLLCVGGWLTLCTELIRCSGSVLGRVKWRNFHFNEMNFLKINTKLLYFRNLTLVRSPF